tara:strand:+ start:164 stop:694 length:531 start_codon:yes stop_codon:yes gene_type:complete
MIKIKETLLNDVKILEPSIYRDERGYFFESYNEFFFNNIFKNIKFVQDNESESKFGTLRGLHFQKHPYEQSKLVRVIKGKIQDIAVDLRPDSSTYKKYVSVILDDHNKNQLFIPKGFAHAFLTLSDKAIVSYKVDAFYSKEYDSGIKFDDPTLNIKWELNENDIYISERDNNLSYL